MLYGMCRLLYVIYERHGHPPSHGDKADDRQYREWKRGHEGEETQSHEREME